MTRDRNPDDDTFSRFEPRDRGRFAAAAIGERKRADLMGFEENAGMGALGSTGRGTVGAPMPGSLADKYYQEQAAQFYADKRAAEEALADAVALTSLAQHAIPANLKEWGRRNNIPKFAQAVWVNAYIAGWRACHRAMGGS
jgi:hypothetical protein